MPEVYVAAGSNVEPYKHLARAARELAGAFPGARCSSWYRNRAVGFEGEDFINFVAGFSTEQPLEAVIAHLQAIEGLCGRTRAAPRWAPRSMDLDILLYGTQVLDTPTVRLPRPDLLKRAYMLGPLAELAPELIHPTAGASIGTLWRQFDQAAHPLIRVPTSDAHEAAG
ncbi:MAG: 2-amino-4-hydroxy-6-hydroxymethyldihydropteridine diphosphokinase [Pseudomonadota bacterium]|jgi:2-amino-4-hydroxy-6-hydroxymethyldihydropteridine diphosphokinase|nr:2-amino-4-hydroxy-6-hydroxymethyldihydropteridine diphosphokinase [Pseudomonadota bacterium]